jgi:hypothetical protein
VISVVILKINIIYINLNYFFIKNNEHEIDRNDQGKNEGFFKELFGYHLLFSVPKHKSY